MARVLITGGRGLLGRELVRELSVGEMSAEALAYTTFRQPAEAGVAGEPFAVDLNDPDAVESMVRDWKPEIVVHTAAPRGRDAESQIVSTTRHVGEAAAGVGARLVHLSTDMVFDGTDAPYGESAKPRPITPYGEAKLDAERTVVRALGAGSSLIVRTSLIYGFDPIDHQTAWMVGAVERAEPITLFEDEFRNPVYVKDLARAVAELALGAYSGVLHVAGAQRLNRWEIGRRILETLGLDFGGLVAPGLLAKSGLHRPPDLTLDLTKAASVLTEMPRGLDDVIEARSDA